MSDQESTYMDKEWHFVQQARYKNKTKPKKNQNKERSGKKKKIRKIITAAQIWSKPGVCSCRYC